MTRILLIIAFMCASFIAAAGQRVWFEADGDYYDPANPWHRKALYLDLPLPKADDHYQVALYHDNGQLALKAFSPTPEFDRDTLLGEVVEYYDDGQVLMQASYVPRDQICDCGNDRPVLHGDYRDYHPNGQVHRSVSYYGGGLVDGDYTEYDAEGRITLRYSIKNYRRHGDYAKYQNGQLMREFRYVEGSIEGPYREFNEEGQLVKKATYSDGQYQGLVETYRDGVLVGEENYQAGRRRGLQKTYYPDGTPERVYTASEFHAKPVGEDRHYRRDGSLSQKTLTTLDSKGRTQESRKEYFDEEERLVKLVHKQGEWQLQEEYDQKGELSYRREEDDKGLQGLLLTDDWSGFVRAHYRDGEEHGTTIREASDGTRVEGRYESGKKEGLWVTLEPDGAREEIRYRDDELHGLHQRFDASGERTGYVNYDNGKKHGPADHYDYGHRVVTRYHQGEPDGDYLETKPDGRILHQGQYRRGQPEGVHYHFSEVGQMLKKQSYRDGVAHGEWIEVGYGGMTVIRKLFENGELVSEMDIALDSLNTSQVR